MKSRFCGKQQNKVYSIIKIGTIQNAYLSRILSFYDTTGKKKHICYKTRARRGEGRKSLPDILRRGEKKNKNEHPTTPRATEFFMRAPPSCHYPVEIILCCYTLDLLAGIWFRHRQSDMRYYYINRYRYIFTPAKAV